MGKGYFDVPLNLPHAGTIAGRLVYHIDRLQEARGVRYTEALELAEAMERLLNECRFTGENPSPEEAKHLVPAAADLGRRFVSAVRAARCGDDRLGQAVRNYFECLELSREGAMLSLDAGENPDSALRPS